MMLYMAKTLVFFFPTALNNELTLTDSKILTEVAFPAASMADINTNADKSAITLTVPMKEN